MTICLKFFGCYFASLLRPPTFCCAHRMINFLEILGSPSVRLPLTPADLLQLAFCLPNSLGSKNSFGRRRCLGDRGSDQLLWK